MALAASFASMGGLFVAFLPSPRDLPSWAVALLVSAALFLLVLVLLECLDRRGCRVNAKSDAEGIRSTCTIGLNMVAGSPCGHGT